MSTSKKNETFMNDLTKKIKTAKTAKVRTERKRSPEYKVRSTEIKKDEQDKVIAIGASTGGTEAIFGILNALPPTVPGIVVVQHIPPLFSKMFAERINAQTKFITKEAETGDYLESGKVFIAPGDQHLRIKKIGKRYKIECYKADKVSGHCPSVDVLFESVAKEAGDKAIGVILTGMGYDGAKGLLSMKRKGARTIGQDENSSVVYGMPKVAYEVGAVERQVSLTNIPNTILSMLR